jgi:hypothetical protein
MQQEVRSMPGKPASNDKAIFAGEQFHFPYKIIVSLEFEGKRTFNSALYSLSDGWLRIFEIDNGIEYVRMWPAEVVKSVEATRPRRTI